MNPLSAQPTSGDQGESGVSKAIPIAELAETVRFAMKATRELNLVALKPGGEGVARLGTELGHEVARNLLAGKKEGAFNKLESFCKTSGLGTLRLVQEDPVVMKLSDPHEPAGSSKGESRGARSFKKSLLEAIFQDSLGQTASVHETESGGKGGTEWVIRFKAG